MDHDETCRQHDKELTALAGEVKGLNHDLEAAVVRWQKLVDEMHAQNVKDAEMAADIAHIREKVDVIEDTLKNEVARKSTVDSILKWGTMIAGAFILAFVGAFVAFVLRGGLAVVGTK